MTALSPFSIDMYLPAFQAIATDLGSTVARISLSLSSYFVGISLGQLIYGPLLDRYGRKVPLRIGLAIYVVASLCCLLSHSAEALIAWRFAQALGGCAAGVSAMAMVRDLFSVKESARVFSLLMLIVATSPLLAPTIGGYLAVALGWKSVFIVLAAIALALLVTVHFYLPESRDADHTVALKIAPIFLTFHSILRDARFYAYVVSGAIGFSGLFVYIAGSSVIFLKTFAVSAQVYGWIFATIAAGFIGTAQINVWLLRRFTNENLLRMGMIGQMMVGWAFAILTYLGILDLMGTVAMLFLFIGFFGVISPNGNALAMAPFAKNAGSAAALMGFLQMGIGALASMSVGLLALDKMLPIVLILVVTSTMGVVVLFWGESRIRRLIGG